MIRAALLWMLAVVLFLVSWPFLAVKAWQTTKPAIPGPGVYIARCPDCGWQTTGKNVWILMGDLERHRTGVHRLPDSFVSGW